MLRKYSLYPIANILSHSHSDRPKEAWQIWKYFTYKSIFLKTFEGGMLIRSQTTTLPHIFYEILLCSQVIFKSMKVADDTFQRRVVNGLKVPMPTSDNLMRWNSNKNQQLQIQREFKGFDEPPFTIQNIDFFLAKKYDTFFNWIGVKMNTPLYLINRLHIHFLSKEQKDKWSTSSEF